MTMITSTTGIMTIANGKTYGQGFIVYAPDDKESNPSVVKDGKPFTPVKKDWDWIGYGDRWW